MIKVKVELPGTLRLDGETSEKAMERCISTQLPAIESDVRWSRSIGRETEELRRESPSLGIMTQYTRTVYLAWLCKDVNSTWASPAPSVQLEPEPAARRSRVRSSLQDSLQRQLKRSDSASEAAQESISVQREAIRILSNKEQIIVIPNSVEEGRQDVYTWLLPVEMDILSEEFAVPILRQWLTAHDFSQTGESCGPLVSGALPAILSHPCESI